MQSEMGTTFSTSLAFPGYTSHLLHILGLDIAKAQRKTTADTESC